MPDIWTITNPLIGQPYATMDCFDFIRHLYQQGFGLDLAREGTSAAMAFQEVWHWQQETDPVLLAQAWDLVLFVEDVTWPVADHHMGVMVDARRFVHARRSETGVALGRLRTWKPKLFQMARLRELL
jgi:hypothetical protein